MKKLIITKGTEFEQNRRRLAIIDTEQRAGKPIMLDSVEFDEAIFNGDKAALDTITSDVSNQPQFTVDNLGLDPMIIFPDEGYSGLEAVRIVPPTLEDYMRISDLMEYPQTPQESWYTTEEQNKVRDLINHFESLESEVDNNVE